MATAILLNPTGVQSLTVSNFARFGSGTIQAWRYGRVVVIRFGGTASFSAWEDAVRVCTISGVNGLISGESPIYGQDTARCITVYTTGNGVYVRNKNSVAMNTWFFGSVVALAVTLS